MKTDLKYLERMFAYEDQTTIAGVLEATPGKTSLLLAGTIFYPQGGGQQCDIGRIIGADFEFLVQSTEYSEGDVLHHGISKQGVPTSGMIVSMKLDIERRKKNSKLQSGGHLILNATKNIGLRLVATKGYHFPDGPYVEFTGNVPESAREDVVKQLQMEINRLIDLDLPITAQVVPPEKLHTVCENVPSNVPVDKPTRIVTIDGLSQPCGGTHVPSTGALRGLSICKIKVKKGDTRVSYMI